MTRIALGIEYDGAAFFGWQRQSDVRTVQAVVEKALSKIALKPIQLFCAGRTDTGVHGLGQVAHFDTDVSRPESAWLLGVNRYLPDDVVIHWAKQVDDDFHARFSAVKRKYCYIIYNHRVAPAILRDHVTWHRTPLDAEKMAAAAKCLVGTHDFTSFRSASCQAKSPIRCVEKINLERRADFITIDFEANGFLHHMIRNIVGALLLVGEGKKEPDWIKTVLEQQHKCANDRNALPNGLYFVGVSYPKKQNLPIFMGTVYSLFPLYFTPNEVKEVT